MFILNKNPACVSNSKNISIAGKKIQNNLIMCICMYVNKEDKVSSEEWRSKRYSSEN